MTLDSNPILLQSSQSNPTEKAKDLSAAFTDNNAKKDTVIDHFEQARAAFFSK